MSEMLYFMINIYLFITYRHLLRILEYVGYSTYQNPTYILNKAKSFVPNVSIEWNDKEEVTEDLVAKFSVSKTN